MQTQVLDSHINLFFKSRWKEVALKSNAIKVKRNYLSDFYQCVEKLLDTKFLFFIFRIHLVYSISAR